jgi:hypothetical protein
MAPPEQLPFVLTEGGRVRERLERAQVRRKEERVKWCGVVFQLKWHPHCGV